MARITLIDVLAIATVLSVLSVTLVFVRNGAVALRERRLLDAFLWVALLLVALALGAGYLRSRLDRFG